MNCHCPSPPSWNLNWDAIDAEFDWISSLRGCEQEPLYHAEGDVWVHTRLVCEALVALKSWQQLDESDREDLFWAALLHDIAKPSTTITRDGRITSPNHAPKGALMARKILWQAGMGFERRERIVGLVRYHQKPFWFMDATDPVREVLKISQHCNCGHLALLAEADSSGRLSEPDDKTGTSIPLFVEFCAENHCLEHPRKFASGYTRYRYFREKWDLPDVEALNNFRCKAVVMSGLPGAGKDTWIKNNLPDWPMVSPDEIRKELDVAPTDNQGQVIQATKERARVLLRSGTSFVWNATNITQRMRIQIIGLLDDYNANTRIVYLEKPYETLLAHNAARQSSVPEDVMANLIDKLEVPAVFEAHDVVYHT